MLVAKVFYGPIPQDTKVSSLRVDILDGPALVVGTLVVLPDPGGFDVVGCLDEPVQVA